MYTSNFIYAIDAGNDCVCRWHYRRGASPINTAAICFEIA
jgi:hypothetical protein